jgi:hypothetical protein
MERALLLHGTPHEMFNYEIEEKLLGIVHKRCYSILDNFSLYLDCHAFYYLGLSTPKNVTSFRDDPLSNSSHKNGLFFSEQFSKEGLTKYLMSDENAPILLDRLDIYQV